MNYITDTHRFEGSPGSVTQGLGLAQQKRLVPGGHPTAFGQRQAELEAQELNVLSTANWD